MVGNTIYAINPLEEQFLLSALDFPKISLIEDNKNLSLWMHLC
jgi:hypothetical protein